MQTTTPGFVDVLRKEGRTLVTVPRLMAPAEPEPGTVHRP